MIEYSVKDIQQNISKALRQLKDGDRPIITSNGQAVAALISLADLEKLTMLTAFETPPPQDTAERDVALAVLQRTGGDVLAALALLSRVQIALVTEHEIQQRAARKARAALGDK